MLKSVVIEAKKFKHSPRVGEDNPLGPKSLCQQEGSGDLLQVSKESLQPLTLYTSFRDLINVYSCRSGANNPRGHSFDVNRNNFQKNLFEVRF